MRYCHAETQAHKDTSGREQRLKQICQVLGLYLEKLFKNQSPSHHHALGAVFDLNKEFVSTGHVIVQFLGKNVIRCLIRDIVSITEEKKMHTSHSASFLLPSRLCLRPAHTHKEVCVAMESGQPCPPGKGLVLETHPLTWGEPLNFSVG